MKLTTYLFTILLLFVGLLTAQAAIKDDGLILYFSFDVENGGKIEDKTGGGNDADINNNADITTDEAKYGKGSLECAEASSSVTVASFKDLEAYKDNSYLFWLRFVAGNTGGWDQIIAKHAPGSDRSPGIWTCTNTLNIHWRFNVGNQGTHCSGPDGEGDQFDIGSWYHLAGVKKDGMLTYYVDGKKVENQNVPAAHAQGAGVLYIGKSPSYNSAKFQLDELYIYNRALTEDEVNDVMDGDLLPVEPHEKLSTIWGKMKKRHD